VVPALQSLPGQIDCGFPPPQLGGEISPKNSRIEPLNHRAYSALVLQRRGNNVSLSLAGEISPNRSRIEPLHRVYSALTLQRGGNNVSLSLGGEGRGEGARTLDRCSNLPVHGEDLGEGATNSNSFFSVPFDCPLAANVGTRVCEPQQRDPPARFALTE